MKHRLARSWTWVSSFADKLYTPYLVVMALLTVVMCIAMYVQTHDAVNQNMSTAMDASLNQISRQLEQQMDEMEQLGQIIWINPHFQAMLPAVHQDKVMNYKDISVYYELLDAFEDLRKVNKPYSMRIYVNDNAIFSEERKMFYPIREIEQQGWYDQVQANNGRFFWHLMRDGSGPPVLSVLRSSFWTDEMGKRAVVYVGFLSSYLDSALINPFVESGGHTLLMTAEGEIISGSADALFPDSIMPEDLRNAVLSDQSTADWSGRHYQLARQSLDRPGLVLVSIVPRISAWDAMRSSFAGTMTMLSLFLVILVLVAVFFAGRYRRRISNLVRHIETIEGDVFSKRIDVKGGGEIAVIERKFNDMSLRLSIMMDEIRESDRRKRKAELDALQSQMNPHFLHNTLDAINWMAIDARQFEIAETVATLGSFFRMVMSGSDSIITVQQELDLTEQYVKIQQLRNRDKLDLAFDVEQRCLPYLCVKLLIQPLIENAIKHSNKAGNVMRIRVQIAMENEDHLTLSVLDNGIGITAAAEPTETRRNYRSGYGLKSVEQRLMLHFGQDIMMSLGEGLDGVGTCVTLKWPARLPEPGAPSHQA
ncbi:sensor histidine kinase [Eubacteriales bacterium OttesenSCG-928-N13]|nr:sensor histidine kinase [Eubacteriales bacterium OttesenSCG-928-N13]